MFFGEIETKLSEDALLSASLILDNNLSKVKISKGTKIDKSIIKLLLNNNIQRIMCAKLDQDDIDERKEILDFLEDLPYRLKLKTIMYIFKDAY